LERGVAAAGAGDVRHRVGVVDAALGLERVVVPVVLKLVCLDPALALAHDHVSAQRQHAVRAADHAVALDADLAATRKRLRADGGPVAAGAGDSWCGRSRHGRRARGGRWLIGSHERAEAAERQQGGPEWVPTRHVGRHYNGRMPENDARLALLEDWLARDLGLLPQRIERASSDASFRRYFRVVCDDCTLVAMDAPPPNEDVRPYLKVTALLEPLGVHVPHVYEADVTRGFVLLEDLGSTHYLAQLGAGGDPQRLYGDALQALAEIQLRGTDAAAELAPYDRAPLARELALMPEWFLERHLALELTGGEREMIVAAFEFLIGEALAQPEVFVHRDYHSRNLMVVAERNPGVIDFQDALRGPIGYDLVSLLKDCYISWPRQRVLEWVSGYRSLLQARGGRV